MPTSWDSLFKQIFLRFFEKLDLTAKTQQEVSHQALMIDTVVLCQSAEDIKKLQETAFYFFREHNLLEFKSSSDRLTIPGYHRIQARARLYLSETKNLTLDKMMLCIISSGDPQNVRSNIPGISFENVEEGHYLAIEEPIKTHLYVISDLPIVPKYYLLLLFSKGKKREQYLRVLAERNELEYLRLAMFLYPEEVKEVYQMSRRDYPTLEENIRFIISEVGTQTVLQAINIEEIARNTDQKTLFSALVKLMGGEQISENLPELLAEMGSQAPQRIVQNIDQKALFSELVEQMGNQAPQQIAQNIDKEALLKALVEQMGIKKSQQLLQKWSQENGRDNEK